MLIALQQIYIKIITYTVRFTPIYFILYACNMRMSD